MRALPILALALLLAACATVTRYDAAGDIHALLVAIRDDDREAFDAHVDRPALKEQIRSRLMAEAVKRLGPSGAALAPFMRAVVDPIVDVAVQPDVFLAVAEARGYSPSKPIPSREALTGALRKLDDDRVCVVIKRDGPCILDFRNESGTWKLVAFEGPADLLKTPPLKVGLIPQ